MRRCAASTDSFEHKVRTSGRFSLQVLPFTLAFLQLNLPCTAWSAPLSTPAMVPTGTGPAFKKLQEGRRITGTSTESNSSPPKTINGPVKVDSPAQKMVAEGDAILKTGDSERALSIFRAAEAKFPCQPEPGLGICRALYALNRMQEAMEKSTHLTRQFPRFAGGFAFFGNLQCSKGDLPAARLAYLRAVSLDTTDADLHYRLAQIAQMQGAADDVFSEATKAVALAPGHTGAQLLLSTYEATHGCIQNAVSRLRKALKNDPDNLHFLILLATMQREIGENSAALENLKAARSIDSNDAGILEQFVLIYGAKNDWINAREYSEEWTKSEPDNALAWFMHAWCCMKTNELTDAVSYYKRAIALKPALSELHNGYGMVLLDSRKLDDAAREFQKASELASNDVVPQLNQATVHISAARWTEAIDLLRHAAANFPDCPQLNGLLAYCLARAANFTDASNMAQRALAVNQNEPMALTALSIIDEHNGELERSIDHLQRVVHLFPASSFAITELASAYLRNHNPSKAVTLAQEALQVAPYNLNAKATMAEVLKALGNFHGAALLLKECVVRNPKDLALKLSLAEAQEKSGDRDGAISTLEKARKSHPSAPEPLAQLANFLLGDKDYKQAESLSRESLQYNSNYVPSLLVLGKVLLITSRLEECLLVCEQMLNSAPDDRDVSVLSGLCLSRLGKWKEARKCFDRIAQSYDASLAPEVRLAYAETLEKTNDSARASQVISGINGDAGLSSMQLKLLRALRLRLDRSINKRTSNL